MTRSKNRERLSIAALAITGVVAGCGGGDGQTAATGESAATDDGGNLSTLATGTADSNLPSSKFAAHVSQAGEGLHLLHSGVASGTASGVPAEADNEDRILETYIKTASKSDLLIGVSLQSSLFTDTLVKGRNGSSEQAGVEAGIMVHVEIDGVHGSAYPTNVIFAKRFQELTATLGGVIESCNVAVEDTGGDGVADSGTIVLARDCVVTEEEIGLMLTTTSANHFNFVVPDLEPGVHSVQVHARALASAEFVNGMTPITFDAGSNPLDYAPTADNEATAWALVEVGSLTVEEVRATNVEGGIVIDVDAGV